MDDDGSAPSVTPAVTASVTTSASAVDPFKSQLINLLNIPAYLTGSGDVSLPVAYQKYKAFLVASSTLKLLDFTIHCVGHSVFID